jgi:5-formyltetrahydrofolate cyclo-ligase
MSDLTPAAEKSPQIKISLRARLLTARRSLPVTARSAAAAKIQDQAHALVRETRARSIAAYVPIGSEPGGPDLPARLLAALPPGGRLLLPVLLPDNDLDWAELTSTAGLVAGPRGLLEPSGPRLGVDAVRSVDLLLVPALAVGRDGTRMGRGGGSYDRVLARLPGPAGDLTPVRDPSSRQEPLPARDQTPRPDPDPRPHLAPSAGPIPTADLTPSAGPARPVGPARLAGLATPANLTPSAGLAPDLSLLPRHGPLTVALLHDGEDVDAVPAEPHDRRVHAVITPTGGLSRRPM